MLWFRYPNCLILCVVLLWTPPASVFALSFQVKDAQGNPLENAVILLPGALNDQANTVAVMDQIDKNFVPHVLVIQQGQQVLFPNSDNIRHHVYSFSPTKPFEIKLYAGVPEAPIRFDNAGIVVLGCNIHDRMLGYIVVADTALAGKTDAQGNVTLGGDRAADSLRVWHPLLLAPVPEPVTLPMPAADANGVRQIQLSVSAPAPETPRSSFGNRLNRRDAP